MKYMSKVSYSNAIESLIYELVCTHPNISYDVSVMSKYIKDPGKAH